MEGIIFKTGADAEDARDELIEERKLKYCPNKNHIKPTVYCSYDRFCDGESCAVFCKGEITKERKGVYYISEVPHCGLIKK